MNSESSTLSPRLARLKTPEHLKRIQIEGAVRAIHGEPGEPVNVNAIFAQFYQQLVGKQKAVEATAAPTTGQQQETAVDKDTPVIL